MQVSAVEVKQVNKVSRKERKVGLYFISCSAVSLTEPHLARSESLAELVLHGLTCSSIVPKKKRSGAFMIIMNISQFYVDVTLSVASAK